MKNNKEIWDTMKKTNLKTIGIDKGATTQIKDTESIFNKIREKISLTYRRTCLSKQKKHTENTQYKIQIESEEKVPLAHNNQNAKYTEQRKNIKSFKGKD